MPLFDSVVSHVAEWPTEIKDLACLLDSPIPSQLVNDPCPVVSSRASPLLEELRNSLMDSPEQLTNSDSEVLDILDLVLSTVGKRQYSLDHGYPTSVVNDEASGHLSMMTAERSNEESQEEYDSETSHDNEFSSETSYEVSTDPTSAQSSYVPFDAHILASWRHPNSVVLPFLCVTDEEDIFSLMGGVLYQRSTWGISEPVIGIILSKTGFVCRVVLGWLDKVCPDPEVLPAIRFAYGDETRTDATLGVYDLTDPVSAVKFSQFILGLRAHVEGIVTQCHTPTFKRLSWRSDSIDDDNSGTEEQWKQRIVNWLDTVAKCRAPSDSSSSHSCSFPIAESEKRRTRSSSKSRSATPSTSAGIPGIGLAQPQKPSLEAARSKTLSDGVSVQSEERGRQDQTADLPKLERNERRAQMPYLVLRRPSFSSYAHDRYITGLTNVQFTVNTKELEDSKTPASEFEELETVAAEINEMLGFYEEMTQYMKPPIAKHGLPVVDKRVEAVREHFRSQVDALPAGPNTWEHPQEFWEVISGSLSSLLWASVGGYSQEQGGKDHNEAEARHEWNILLNLGFVNTKELASGRVVLERTLSLSRNVAADLAKSSTLFDGKTFRAVADQGYEISLHVQQVLNRLRRASHLHPALLPQAADVVNFAIKYRTEVLDLFKDAGEAKHTVSKRNGDEPELGIVDAILTIPPEHGPKSSEPLVRITETRETVQAARTLHADNIAEPDDKPVSETEPQKANGHAKKSKSSRAGSRRTASTSRMVAIAEEQLAAQELPQGTKKANKKGKMKFPSGVVMNITALAEKLLLTVLVVEYKKRTQTYAKAVVQAKMYLEASVRYLASLGVTKQGVFALATDGVEGAILMAWCSGDSERVYIVERNVRTFNISSPIEVYHFITVLLRLREYGDTALKAAVGAALKTKDFKQSTWSKTAQFNRME
ncbi:hypothetical protein ARMSODRAFT_1014963 [Armillaria solidipes]|uniref:Uncharacterized protein n=1 Tax=Armillaria solidipes TaxID=1076256 RepID=A0A2H3BR71_9AGAR|nr:hypothetical protein ARMSODRAFT_1014963 [Armillaria solidipes]